MIVHLATQHYQTHNYHAMIEQTIQSQTSRLQWNTEGVAVELYNYSHKTQRIIFKCIIMDIINAVQERQFAKALKNAHLMSKFNWWDVDPQHDYMLSEYDSWITRNSRTGLTIRKSLRANIQYKLISAAPHTLYQWNAFVNS